MKRCFPHRSSFPTVWPVVYCWLLAAAFQFTGVAWGQEAIRYSLADETAIETNRLDLGSMPYTLRSGDFRLLITPSIEADWNDNVTLVKDNPVQDYIVRPMVQFDGSYPITEQNLLQFRIGAGYDFYTQHGEFSALRLQSGSVISFDTFVNNFHFNVHDRFQYIQDPAVEASVAGTGRYGGLDNTAGLSAVWDLENVFMTLGYDHRNFVSSTTDFNYLDLASELVLARVGFRPLPNLTNGLEATGAFTSYDQRLLNDSDGYSLGAFADWNPGAYFQLQARAGYAAYLFEQTSLTQEAFDRYSVYGGVTAAHQVSAALRYLISAGHEARLAKQADYVQDWYIRSQVDWGILKNLKFSPTLSFQDGKQGQTNPQGTLVENYTWLTAGFNLTEVVTRDLTATLRYRATVRGSSVDARSYDQNFLGVIFAYQFN
jgi:hypothetical protein